MNESETIQKIDEEIEPLVQAEIQRMEKNFECHGSIYDCQHIKRT